MLICPSACGQIQPVCKASDATWLLRITATWGHEPRESYLAARYRVHARPGFRREPAGKPEADGPEVE